MKYSLRVSNVSISWRMFGWFSLKNIHKNSKQWSLKVFFIISEPVLNSHLKIEVNEQYLTLLSTWLHVLFKCKQKKTPNWSLLSFSASHHPSIIHPSVHQLPAYNLRIMISFLAALRTFLPSFLRNFLQKNTLSLCLSLARHNSQNSFLQSQHRTEGEREEIRSAGRN